MLGAGKLGAGKLDDVLDWCGELAVPAVPHSGSTRRIFTQQTGRLTRGISRRVRIYYGNSYRRVISRSILYSTRLMAGFSLAMPLSKDPYPTTNI